ncbi:MAG TPA: glycosyltransferase family 2 protein [Candidatus Hydrogenedentes bacterium]|nr:glycosyltransferase family 2 protein [Candidatus Hydrogenedentota bacterium]HPO85362.1 glycosyltransferase family 2 protein [Candidatus Hydrogenedentota bacterium]
MRSSRESDLTPVPPNTLFYSIVVPAHNEEKNIEPTLRALAAELRKNGIPFELVVVNDNSRDRTEEVVDALRADIPEIYLVSNPLRNGLGRAVRCGLAHVKGDVIAIVMADCSDDPRDVVACYRKIEEGYDCVFGSRFIRGSVVTHYPPVKRVVNRIVNHMIRLLFMTRLNDLTNAFKVYRRHVIESIQPLRAAHFNITIEMSLSALIRKYRIAQIPINWTGRTWGSSNLRLRQMGRRYLCTLLKIWFERLLILDDILDETAVNNGVQGEKEQTK